MQVLSGVGEREAQDTLKQTSAKDVMLQLARDRSGLGGFELKELLQGIENYWTDRERRNRYYHDEWFVSLANGGVAATRGLPWKKGSEVQFDMPSADEIWGLAARFKAHEDLFSHVCWRVRRKEKNP